MVDTGKLTAPSDWQTDRNPVNIAVLGKWMEELAELQQAIARCMIQGIDEKHPVTGKSNREWLQEEMADAAAMELLARRHFRLSTDEAREAEKFNHKEAWLKLIRK
jgi:hypothetical protein